jgi:hypothetical protein
MRLFKGDQVPPEAANSWSDVSLTIWNLHYIRSIGPNVTAPSKRDGLFMPVTPQPSLAGLCAANNGMVGCVEVGCRVAVLRVIAAGDVSTFQTHPQMHPYVT